MMDAQFLHKKIPKRKVCQEISQDKMENNFTKRGTSKKSQNLYLFF